MIQFVYRQRNHESTVSSIAEFYSSISQKIHYNRVCAWNRKAAKALYHQYGLEPPIDKDGKKRYWNAVFDGETETLMDEYNHFYWKLRPNLILAMEAIYSHIFYDQTCHQLHWMQVLPFTFMEGALFYAHVLPYFFIYLTIQREGPGVGI